MLTTWYDRRLLVVSDVINGRCLQESVFLLNNNAFKDLMLTCKAMLKEVDARATQNAKTECSNLCMTTTLLFTKVEGTHSCLRMEDVPGFASPNSFDEKLSLACALLQ